MLYVTDNNCPKLHLTTGI